MTVESQTEEGSGVVLTILMPCLNEAETIEACISEAQLGIRDLNVSAEILIADNGSHDGSQELARAMGARVIDVATRGYGAALNAGIVSAKGQWIVMGDADCSYDFSNLGPLVDALKAGSDLVVGNRFHGGIHDGAMPMLHRYLGNPVLSFLGRQFFRVPIGDFHCGLRAFNRAAISELDLTTTGMEFASEMIVKAAIRGCRISEVPTVLRRDGRSRPPHLRTWRDGWRHLRFLLIYSPRYLFLLPGILLTIVSLALGGVLLVAPRRFGSVSLDIHTLLYLAGATFIGMQSTFFAIFAKAFGITSGLLPRDERMERAFQYVTLETGLVAGVVLILAGAGLAAVSVLEWQDAQFGRLDPSRTMRVAIPAVFSLMLGCQVVLGSFLLSLIGLRRRGTL